MNDNELNLEQLKSVYKAHTEAYLEFNLALINILTNQQEILSKVSDLKDLSEDEFKKLSLEYYALEKLFKNFQSTQVDRDTAIEQNTEEYTAQISHFGAEMDNLRKDIGEIKSLHLDAKNWFNRIAWTAAGIGIVLTLITSVTGKPWMELFHR